MDNQDVGQEILDLFSVDDSNLTNSTDMLDSYADVIQWMDRKSEEYGGRVAFIASAEYRDAYPKITKITKEHEADRKEWVAVRGIDGLWRVNNPILGGYKSNNGSLTYKANQAEAFVQLVDALEFGSEQGLDLEEDLTVDVESLFLEAVGIIIDKGKTADFLSRCQITDSVSDYLVKHNITDVAGSIESALGYKLLKSKVELSDVEVNSRLVETEFFKRYPDLNIPEYSGSFVESYLHCTYGYLPETDSDYKELLVSMQGLESDYDEDYDEAVARNPDIEVAMEFALAAVINRSMVPPFDRGSESEYGQQDTLFPNAETDSLDSNVVFERLTKAGVFNDFRFLDDIEFSEGLCRSLETLGVVSFEMPNSELVDIINGIKLEYENNPDYESTQRNTPKFEHLAEIALKAVFRSEEVLEFSKILDPQNHRSILDNLGFFTKFKLNTEELYLSELSKNINEISNSITPINMEEANKLCAGVIRLQSKLTGSDPSITESLIRASVEALIKGKEIENTTTIFCDNTDETSRRTIRGIDGKKVGRATCSTLKDFGIQPVNLMESGSGYFLKTNDEKRILGLSTDGELLFENDEGVRSTTISGMTAIMQVESVGIKPTNTGMKKVLSDSLDDKFIVARNIATLEDLEVLELGTSKLSVINETLSFLAHNPPEEFSLDAKRLLENSRINSDEVRDLLLKNELPGEIKTYTEDFNSSLALSKIELNWVTANGLGLFTDLPQEVFEKFKPTKEVVTNLEISSPDEPEKNSDSVTPLILNNSSEEFTLGEAKVRKISDTGYIPGAAKERWGSLGTSLSNDATVEELVKGSLNDAFPQIDPIKLSEAGVERKDIAAIVALRSMVPRKPGITRKINTWASEALEIRKLAHMILDSSESNEKFWTLISEAETPFDEDDVVSVVERYLPSDECLTVESKESYQYFKEQVERAITHAGEIKDIQIVLDDYPEWKENVNSLGKNTAYGNYRAFFHILQLKLNELGVMRKDDLSKVADKIEFVDAFPYECMKNAAADYTIRKYIRTKQFNSPYQIMSKNKYIGKPCETLGEAIDAVRDEIIAKITEKQNKPKVAREKKDKPLVKLQLFRARGRQFLGYKGSEGVSVAKYAPENITRQELSEWKTGVEDEVLKELSEKKQIELRGEENRERSGGLDWRSGKDITEDQLKSEFGFKEIQFGNSTLASQKEAQEKINQAYDAFKDMASALGISSKAVGLGGELSLAFGARGKGGRNAGAAHYEPSYMIINLTRKNGRGSLAHEWFHSQDHNLGRIAKYGLEDTINGLSSRSFATDRANNHIDIHNKLRSEVKNSFLKIKNGMRDEFLQACKDLDNLSPGKSYWSTPIEMAARTFEAYMKVKLDQQSITNDFLVNVNASLDPLDQSLSNVTPNYYALHHYGLFDAFEELFDNLNELVTDKGIILNKHEDPAIMQVAEAWSQATEKDLDLFKFDSTDKKEIVNIFSDNGYEIINKPSLIQAQIEERIEFSDQLENAWMVTTPSEDYVFVYETNEYCWIDVSALGQMTLNENFQTIMVGGSGNGAEIYQMVANYAYNSGKVFIGDPLGSSEIAVARRTENMLSSALRFGTTRHLKPSQQQIGAVNSANAKINNIVELKWSDDDRVNLENLIRTSYENVRSNIPEIEYVIFDTERSEFRVSGATPDFIDQSERIAERLNETWENPGAVSGRPEDLFWRELSPVARALAGSSTLKRAVVTQTLLRNTSPENKGSDFSKYVEELFATAREIHALDGVLYRDDETNSLITPDQDKYTEIVRNWIEPVIGDTGVEIIVVPTVNQLPSRVRLKVHSTVPGVYDVGTRTPYIIANRIRNEGHAIKTALHEGLGHEGVISFLRKNASKGGDRLEAILDNIYSDIGEVGIKEALGAYEFDYSNTDDKREAVLEYIAHLAENNEKPIIVNEVIGSGQDLLETMYENVSWSRDDILSLIEVSRLSSLIKELKKEEQLNLAGSKILTKQYESDIYRLLNQSGGRLAKLLSRGSELLSTTGLEGLEYALNNTEELMENTNYGYLRIQGNPSLDRLPKEINGAYGAGIYIAGKHTVVDYFNQEQVINTQLENAENIIKNDLVDAPIIINKSARLIVENKLSVRAVIKLQYENSSEFKNYYDQNGQKLLNSLVKISDDSNGKEILVKFDLEDKIFLDWDTSIENQSEIIKQISSLLDIDYQSTGKEVYYGLVEKGLVNNEKGASEYLMNQGVGGITYFSNDYTTSEDDISYVLFDAGYISMPSPKDIRKATNKTIDLSREARLTRAEAMGFDTNVTYYHGTNVDFDEFDSKAGGDQQLFGTHLGTKVAANDVASGNVGGVVYPVYTSTVNPLRLPDLGHWEPAIVAEHLKRNNIAISSTTEFYTSQMLIDAIKSAGYDSIIYSNTWEDKGSDSIIVFDESKIRSVNAEYDLDLSNFNKILYKDEIKKGETLEVKLADNLKNITDSSKVLDNQITVNFNDGSQCDLETNSSRFNISVLEKYRSEALSLKTIEIKGFIGNSKNLEKFYGDGDIREAIKNTGFDIIGIPTQITDYIANASINNENTFISVSDKAKSLERINTNFLFAGINAVTANITKLDEAISLSKTKTSADVWKETGWLKGIDGQWKFEIDDSKSELNSLILEKFDSARSMVDNLSHGQGILEMNMAEVLTHEDLYLAYPGMKNTKVVFKHTENIIQKASCNLTPEPVIILNIHNKYTTRERLKSSLLHELSHLIQEAEGFTKGRDVTIGSLNRLAQIVENKNEELLTSKSSQEFTQNLVHLNNLKKVSRFNEFKEISKSELTIEKINFIKSTEEYSHNIRSIEEQLGNEPPIQYKDRFQVYWSEFNNSLISTLENSLKQSPLLDVLSSELESLIGDTTNKLLKNDFSVVDLELAKDVRKQLIDSIKSKPIKRVQVYERLSGEVETRNVQRRLNYNSDLRNSRHPVSTKDIESGEQLAMTTKGSKLLQERLLAVTGKKFNVHTIETKNELPNNAKSILEKINDTPLAIVSDNNIFLINDSIMNSDININEALNHELSHDSVRSVLGNGLSKEYARFWDAIGKESGIKKEALIADINFEPYTKLTEKLKTENKISEFGKKQLLVDEFICHSIDKQTNQNLSQKARRLVNNWVGGVRNILRKHGLTDSSEMSKSDIAYSIKVVNDSSRGRHKNDPVIISNRTPAERYFQNQKLRIALEELTNGNKDAALDMSMGVEGSSTPVKLALEILDKNDLEVSNTSILNAIDLIYSGPINNNRSTSESFRIGVNIIKDGMTSPKGGYEVMQRIGNIEVGFSAIVLESELDDKNENKHSDEIVVEIDNRPSMEP
jgi:hypothetical protein